MKKYIIFIIILISVHCQAQYNKENLNLRYDKSYQFENLMFYPVRANDTFKKHHEKLGDYTTLKEALEKKLISIKEVSNGDVNKLLLQNISRDTIMILSGEVVAGGKQDRMIAEDLILYPMSSKKEVSVFCVEHGRWSARQGDMSFNQYYTISSKEVRKAGTVSKNQGEVWNKVSETTQKNDASSRTGTLTNLRNSASFNADLRKYSSFFGNLLIDENDVIGIIAVSGNEILGGDLFASHDLFVKHYENLVHSYAAEAITSGKPVTIPKEKVIAYFNSIMDESKQEREIKEKGTMLKEKDKKLHISTF